jgi:hypothetical protein
MLFKEIIVVYTENRTKPVKYKMQKYLLLKQVVHIVTNGL